MPYPVACAPQAWAAGAIPYLLKWGLGLSPDALNRRLRIIRPSLPHWLGRVEVTGLRVGDASVDLRSKRSDGDIEVALEIAGGRRALQDV